jgi:uncharacterized membrane protein YbaN (DUF454 family)
MIGMVLIMIGTFGIVLENTNYIFYMLAFAGYVLVMPMYIRMVRRRRMYSYLKERNL